MLRRVLASSAGSFAAAALVFGGSSSSSSDVPSAHVFGFGHNLHGQLGLGNTTQAPKPERVRLSRDATLIAAGGDSSAAVGRDGKLYTWGRGPLGHGSMTSSTTV